MKENVLITGGSGLLGSEINIPNSFKPSSYELNILNYDALSRFIVENNIKKIIHCAAKVGGVEANNNGMYDFFMENIKMNTNVMMACKEHNLINSIFILSTCVMPASAKLPYTEACLHDGEPHPTNYGYAYAKRMLEVGSRSMLKQHGIKTKCIIPCNLYGKNDNYNLEDGHVIPGLIHKCFLAKRENKDFSVWGSGNPEREFMYAADLARIIEEIDIKTIDFETMIVSPSIYIKIRDLATIVAEKLNFKGKIVFDSSRPDGILRKPTDNSIFKSKFPDFKWTSMEKGIEDTVSYFIENYECIRK
jgi:GDP-L-fucose synthase